MSLPPNAKDAIRVFVSYSRRDLDVADRLVSALEGQGFSVTIDRRDLPYGEEWLKELADFIAGADTVVALVSPSFIHSKACNWELAEVRARSKRLVPVVIESVGADDLPETIGKIQLLPATGVFSFQAHLNDLANTLDTDWRWVKEHTRLTDRARQWIVSNRNSSLLLRGRALSDAERWKDRQPKAAPPPGDEILELMLASHRASISRQRVIAAASIFAAIFASVLAAAAFLQWQRAEKSYAAARTNFDLLIKDLAAEMQNVEGMPVMTVNRILKNGQVLAENLKESSRGDERLEASRGAMFYEFGKTYQKIGQRPQAITASEESLAIRKRLVAAHPSDEEAAAALSESLHLAGDLEREEKRYDNARRLYGESASISERLNAKRPAHEAFGIAFSKTLIRLGDIDRLEKSPQQAKSRYAHAFEVMRSVFRKATKPSILLLRELTWNYNKLGDVDFELKNFTEARFSYEKALCLRKQLLSKAPGNTQLLHDISWSYDKIAGARAEVLDFEQALDAQFTSLFIRRKLVAGDAKNLIWRRDEALALHLIAEIKARANDLPGAVMFFVAAAEAGRVLKKEAPNNSAAAAA